MILTHVMQLRLDSLHDNPVDYVALLRQVRTGAVSGLLCRHCGVTVDELLRWPGLLCLARPRVVNRLHIGMHGAAGLHH